jgi:transmembrane sensor
MKKTGDPASDAKAEARAWLVRLRSGDATPDDLRAYRLWCAEHPEHAKGAHAMSDVWSSLNAAATEMDAEAPAFTRSWTGRAAAAHPLRPGRRAFVGFAVAAGASWLALRPPLGLWPALGDYAADYAADYRTATGEQRRVALSGRMTVEMNTQTRIDVLPVQAAQHGIDLLAGEAEIVASASSTDTTGRAGPVLVVAGRGRIQADVARFDVRRTGNEVCVTCVSGSIAFEHPQRRLTLGAAQQFVYNDREVRDVSAVDPRAVTAWRRGVLVFNGVPLAQVVDEINRYRPGKLILRNAELGRGRVQAQFSLTRLDGAIDMIGKLYGANVRKLPGNIVVLS